MDSPNVYRVRFIQSQRYAINISAPSPELAEFFLSGLAEDLGRPGLRFSPEALSVLRSYAFPGNVRQLQNMVERAATLAESDVLGPETLPPTLRGEQPTPPPGTDSVELGEAFSLEKHLDEAERRYLLAALRRANGVKTRAAIPVVASAPPSRFSTRRACGSENGTRRPAVRLSKPHCTLIGAEW